MKPTPTLSMDILILKNTLGLSIFFYQINKSYIFFKISTYSSPTPLTYTTSTPLIDITPKFSIQITPLDFDVPFTDTFDVHYIDTFDGHHTEFFYTNYPSPSPLMKPTPTLSMDILIFKNTLGLSIFFFIKLINLIFFFKKERNRIKQIFLLP